MKTGVGLLLVGIAGWLGGWPFAGSTVVTVEGRPGVAARMQCGRPICTSWRRSDGWFASSANTGVIVSGGPPCTRAARQRLGAAIAVATVGVVLLLV